MEKKKSLLLTLWDDPTAALRSARCVALPVQGCCSAKCYLAGSKTEGEGAVLGTACSQYHTEGSDEARQQARM